MWLLIILLVVFAAQLAWSNVVRPNIELAKYQEAMRQLRDENTLMALYSTVELLEALYTGVQSHGVKFDRSTHWNITRSISLARQVLAHRMVPDAPAHERASAWPFNKNGEVKL